MDLKCFGPGGLGLSWLFPWRRPVEFDQFRVRRKVEPLLVTKLEERIVLNADFDGSVGGADGVILLDGFAADVDLTVGQNSSNDYEFVLSQGVWNGVDISDDVVASGDTLTIKRNFPATIEIDDSAGNDPDIVFDRIDLRPLNNTNSLTLTGVGEITQTGRIRVEDFSVNGATLITLTHVDNDFDDVSIVASGDTYIEDTDSIDLGTISVTNGALPANLTIDADNDVTQSGTITVDGTATFDSSAGSISLSDPLLDNMLSGSVSLLSANSAQLRNTVDTDLGTVDVVDDLDLDVTGGITQSQALTVGRTTQLTATGNITLDTHANDFDGDVSVSVDATSDVSIRNDDTSATFGSLSTMHDFTVVHTNSAVALASIDLSGALNITSDDNITQSMIWEVAGTTTLNANGTVTLDRANVLEDEVSITTTGTANATIRNDHTTAAFGAVSVGGNLVVDASSSSVTGGVTQSSAWSVDGTTTINAIGDIALGGQANVLQGVVNVTTTDASDMADVAIQNTHTTASFGTVDVDGNLVVDASNASVTGGVTQSSAWSVAGTTSINAAGAVALGGQANVLEGEVSITTTGTVNATIRNDHTTAAFGAVSVGGNLVVDASSSSVTGGVTQSSAWSVDGTTTINAIGDVALGGQANVLQGVVNVTTTDASDMADVAIQNTHTTASFGTVDVDGNLVVDASNASVTGGVTQSSAWSVAGTTSINAAGAVALGGQANVLEGEVSITTTGTVNATIRNDHTTAAFGAVSVGGNLVVDASSSSVTGGVTQSSAWSVDGTTTINAIGDVALGGQANVLQGVVNVTTTDASDMADVAIQNTHTTASFGTVDVDGNLVVDASNASVTGGVTQSSAWSVAGTTSINAAGAVALGGQANVLEGEVSITTTGTANATIRNDHTTAAFGAVSVGGNLVVDASSSSVTGGVTQSSAWSVDGTTTINAIGDVALGGQANVLQGVVNVTASGTSNVDIRNDHSTAAFGTVDVGGAFDVNAGGSVTQSTAWTVDGTTTIDANGAIQLGAFANVLMDTITLTSGANTAIRNAHTSSTLGAIDSGGALEVEVIGDITQTAVWHAVGNTTLETTGDIELDAFANQLDGAITIDGVASTVASIVNASTSAGSYSVAGPVTDLTLLQTQASVTLDSIDISGNLEVTSDTGNVAQGGAWLVDGTTSVNAGGAIQLGVEANVLMNAISMTSGTNASIRNTHTSSSFSTIDSGGSLSVDVIGNITHSSIWTVDGTTALTTTGNVFLDLFANQLHGDVTIDGVASSSVSILNASNSPGSYSVPNSLATLTIEHPNAGVTLNSVHTTNDLSITASSNISQGGVWNVDQNTNLEITNDGSILLASFANDLAGSVTVSTAVPATLRDLRIQNVSATATLPTVPANLENLEIVYPNADVLIPAVSISQDLIIESLGTIQAGGALDVDGLTSLTINTDGADVLLDAHTHFLNGAVQVAGAGAISLGDVTIVNASTVGSVNVDVANSANTIDLDFGSTDVVLGAVDADSVTVVGEANISQSGRWDIATSTTLELSTAGTIDAGDFANMLDGTIAFTTLPGSNILYRNATATASVPVLPAALHDLTIVLDQSAVTLPAINLTGDLSIVSHGSIQQTGTWMVDGTTTLELTDSGDILLALQNDFAMPVEIVAPAPITVGTLQFHNENAAASLIGLPSSVDDLTIHYANASLELPEVTVTNGLSVSSHGTLSQTGALIVGGSSAFTLTSPGDALLTEDNQFTNQAPTFAGPINHLFIRDILPTAQLPILPAGLTQLTIEFESAPVVLPTIATPLTGPLAVIAGGDVTQSGELNVQDIAITLASAGDVVLNSSSNTIDGTMSLSGSIRDVQLNNDSLTPSFPTINAPSSVRDMEITFENVAMVVPDVTVAGELTLVANGNITQSGEINAGSVNATVTAAGSSINLSSSSNDLGNAVHVASSGTGSLLDVMLADGTTDSTSFSTAESLNGLTLDFNGAVNLSGLTAASLVITSRGLTQTGALDVGGSTTLNGISGSDIELASEINQFAGTITVGGSVNDLEIRNAHSSAAAPVLSTGINSLRLIHDSNVIELGALSLAGSLDLTSAGTISQTGVFSVAGVSSFALTSAGDVLLADRANDLGGAVTVSGLVDSLELRNVNNTASVGGLPATGLQDLLLVFDAAGVQLPAMTIGNSMTLDMSGDITQSGVVDVGGTTLLNTSGAVLLGGESNILRGDVAVTAGGNVAIQNAHTTAGFGAIDVDGDFSVLATLGGITQSDVWLVDGTTTLDASGAVSLASQPNILQGDVSIATTGNAAIQNAHTTAGFGAVDVDGDFSVFATLGGITQSNVWLVDGITTLDASGDVSLAGQSNILQGDVSITTTGNASIQNAHTTAGFGAVDVDGDLSVLATLGGITQSDVWLVGGTAALDASGAVSLAGQSNILQGDVAVTATGNAAIQNAHTTAGFGAVDVDGDFSVLATLGGITQSNVWLVDGTTTLDASGDVSLASQSNILQGGVSIATTGNAAIQNAHSTAGFGAVDVDGDFSVFATLGGITQSDVWLVDGTTTLDASGAVSLASQPNILQGDVSIATIGNAAIQNAHSTARFGVVDVDGDFSVLATLGGITQSDVWLVDGTTMLDASGGLSLASQANILEGDVLITTTGNAAIQNAHTTAGFGAVDVDGDFSVLATMGGITQSDVWLIDGTTTLTLSQMADVLLSSFANIFLGPIAISGNVQDVAVRNAASNASAPTLNANPDDYTLIHDNSQITLDAIEVNGDMFITSHGTIDQTDAIIVHGDATFLVSDVNSSVLLNNFANQLEGTIDIGSVGVGTLHNVRIQNNVANPAVFNVPTGLNDLELELALATSLDLSAISIAGDLILTVGGDISQSGVWDVGGTSTLTSSGSILLSSESNSIPIISYSAVGQLELLSDTTVDLSGSSSFVDITASGDITVAELGPLNIENIDSTGTAFLTAQGAIESNSATGSITATEAILVANSGIGSADTLSVAAASITATSTTGDIDLENVASTATNVNLIETLGGDARFSQTGGHSLSIDTISTPRGSIDVSNEGGNVELQSISASNDMTVSTIASGDIAIGYLVASDVNIDSAGAIDDTNNDSVTDIEAQTIVLAATSGIGASNHVALEATTITATSDSGDIDLGNKSSADVTVSRMFSGTGDVSFSQTGGFSLTIDDADASTGEIAIENVGHLTVTDVDTGGDVSLTATGATKNVWVDSVSAGNDEIQISATGSVNGIGGGTHLSSSSVRLIAGTGIGNNTPIGVNATSIEADSVNGDISIAGVLRSGGSVVVSTLATGTGDIQFSQSGANSVRINSAQARAGDVDLSTDSGLRAVFVSAGTNGSGDVSIDASGGDVELGYIAAADTVLIDSAGGVEELSSDTNVDIAANGLMVTSADGFGSTNPIETNVNSIEIDGGTGDVFVTNSGALRIGGVGSTVGIATTADIDVEATSIAVGEAVRSIGNSNITLEATSGALDIMQAISISGGSGGTFTGIASGDISVSGSGSISTQTGSVGAIPTPIIADAVDQGGATITAEGNAKINVLINDTGRNYSITVDWSDGDVDFLGSSSNPILGGTTQNFEHNYLANPNAGNAAAAVTAFVSVAYDYRENEANGIQLISAGENLNSTVEVVLEPPGQGIVVGVGIVENATTIRVLETNTAASAPQNIVTSTDAVQVADSARGSSTSVSAPERQLLLRVISPSGDEGEDIALNMEDLADLSALYQRLPDNRYRIYLVMEDGNIRLIVDVQLRGGRPIDPSAIDDEQPERPADQLLATSGSIEKPADPERSSDPTDITTETLEVQHPTRPAEVNSGEPDSAATRATLDGDDVVKASASVVAASSVVLRNKRARAIRRAMHKQAEAGEPISFAKSARRLRSYR